MTPCKTNPFISYAITPLISSTRKSILTPHKVKQSSVIATCHGININSTIDLARNIII